MLINRSHALPAIAAALLATLVATGCNVNQEASAQAAGNTPLPAAVIGQDNGALTSNIPNARDLRRHFRDHTYSGVYITTAGHQQTRHSL